MRAEPYEFVFQPEKIGLIVIDMQRDFVNPGGFGEVLGNDVSLLRDCLILADCVASYFPEFHRVALEMIKAQGGIFGWVATSADLLPVLA